MKDASGLHIKQTQGKECKVMQTTAKVLNVGGGKKQTEHTENEVGYMGVLREYSTLSYQPDFYLPARVERYWLKTIS